MMKLNLSESPAEFARYLSYLYRVSNAHFTDEGKKIGLSPIQSIVLIGIYRHEGSNQKSIGKLIAVDAVVMSRALRELEKQGYVKKHKDKENRRNYCLHLTDSGIEIAEKSLQFQEQYWNNLLQVLTPEEGAALNHILKKISDSIIQE